MQLFFDFLVEIPPVVQFGQGVAVGQVFEFFYQLVFSDDAVDLSFQFIGIKRFGDKITGSSPNNIHIAEGAGVTGDHNDIGPRVIFLYMFEELHAANPWHHHVGDDYLKFLFLEYGDGFFSIIGCCGLEAEGTNGDPQKFQDQGVVINDEDADIVSESTELGMFGMYSSHL